MCIARVFPSFSSIANESFSGFTPSAIKEIKTKLWKCNNTGNSQYLMIQSEFAKQFDTYDN